MTKTMRPPKTSALCHAVVGRDVRAIESLVDDSSTLFVPGGSGLGGVYRGEEAIVGVLQRMADLTDGTLEFSPVQVLAGESDQAILLFGHTHGVRHGAELDTDSLHVFCLRDGRVREIRTFHEKQEAVDDFWAR